MILIDEYYLQEIDDNVKEIDVTSLISSSRILNAIGSFL